MSDKINIKLLEETLRKDGWTMNATAFIIETVQRHEEDHMKNRKILDAAKTVLSTAEDLYEVIRQERCD